MAVDKIEGNMLTLSFLRISNLTYELIEEIEAEVRSVTYMIKKFRVYSGTETEIETKAELRDLDFKIEELYIQLEMYKNEIKGINNDYLKNEMSNLWNNYKK